MPKGDSKTKKNTYRKPDDNSTGSLGNMQGVHPDQNGKQEKLDDESALIASESPFADEIKKDKELVSRENKIFQSIIGDNVEEFKLLFDKMDSEISDSMIYTIFANGTLRIIQLLINEKGKDVVKKLAVTVTKKDSPLIQAFQEVHLEKLADIIGMLSIKATDIQDLRPIDLTRKLFTVINECCEKQSVLGLMKLLVELGAELNPRGFPRTPLHVAIKSGKQKFAELLLDMDEKKQTFMAVTKGLQRTPLHYAALYNQFEVAYELLHSGVVDIAAKDKDGKTALHLAVEAGYTNVVDLFLSHHEKLQKLTNPIFRFLIGLFRPNLFDMQDNNGLTPLHCAVYMNTEGDPNEEWHVNKNYEMVKILLTYGYDSLGQVGEEVGEDRGVNLTLKNKDGFTAFELAVIKGNKNLIRAFLEFGSSLSRDAAKLNELLKKYVDDKTRVEILGFMEKKILPQYATSLMTRSISEKERVPRLSEDELIELSRGLSKMPLRRLTTTTVLEAMEKDGSSVGKKARENIVKIPLDDKKNLMSKMEYSNQFEQQHDLEMSSVPDNNESCNTHSFS